jgi:hypothetical protein
MRSFFIIWRFPFPDELTLPLRMRLQPVAATLARGTVSSEGDKDDAGGCESR